jgi:hypothetical protein
VLGFPIRTPSDHSSVDSSPRLIAASYVLHRLLVPRHPPYALHYLQQRCSRPLCNSQTTHTTQTHSSTSHFPKEMRYDHHLNSVYVLPRKKHAFACSLRTQQCIDIVPAGETWFRVLQELVVSVPPVSSRRSTCGNETGSASPSSEHLCAGTCSGECSLERR